MDAMKFFEERERMCLAHPVACKGCPLSEKFIGICLVWCVKHPEEAIAVVEQWANEHPRQTRQSEFLKHYPNARLDNNGVVDIPPCRIESKFFSEGRCNSTSCSACRREFWMQEVE